MAGLSIKQKVVVWSRGRLGKKVGAGECWDLAEEALKRAAAKTSNDLGPVGKDTDYVWGTLKELKDVEPGDILQFRDHVVTKITKTKSTFRDQSWAENTEEMTTPREHHTAVANGKMDARGMIRTLEQNVVPKGEVVQSKRLFTRSLPAVMETSREKLKHPYTEKMEMAEVVRTVTITVSGTIWAYAPVAK